MSVLLGVFAAIAVTVIFLWAVCFMAHIGHEGIVMKAVDEKVREMSSIPASIQDSDQLESNLRKIPELMEMKQAARQSQYDPLWFLGDSP